MKRAYDVCAALTAVNGAICLVERAYVFAALAEFRCTTKQPLLQLAKNNTSSEDKEKQNMEREER